MFAPVIKKLIEKEESFIERTLPVPGSIFVKEGDSIKPFDRLGECTYSQKQLSLPKNFKPFKYKSVNQFYYQGSILGKIGKNQLKADFNGHLRKQPDGSYELIAVEDKFVLLSGVWGVIHKVFDNNSVLIKTQTKDLLLAASTPINVSGELVVFPNPMEILEKFYMESFSKSNAGKIVYVGHFADREVVKRACEMGAAAIIAGSAHKDTFNFAKQKGLGFGLISGFGKLETPEPIFKLLSVIAYRYVFLNGEKLTLKIPHSPDSEKVAEMKESNNLEETQKDVKKKPGKKNVDLANKKTTPGSNKLTKEKIIREVKKGDDILCLQFPNFGKIGVVDSVSESSIFVKFNIEKGLTEIRLPNFFIIE